MWIYSKFTIQKHMLTAVKIVENHQGKAYIQNLMV